MIYGKIARFYWLIFYYETEKNLPTQCFKTQTYSWL